MVSRLPPPMGKHVVHFTGEVAVFPCVFSVCVPVCVCVIVCLTGWHILFVFSNTDFPEGSEVKTQNTEICFS